MCIHIQAIRQRNRKILPRKMYKTIYFSNESNIYKLIFFVMSFVMIMMKNMIIMIFEMFQLVKIKQLLLLLFSMCHVSYETIFTTIFFLFLFNVRKYSHFYLNKTVPIIDDCLQSSQTNYLLMIHLFFLLYLYLSYGFSLTTFHFFIRFFFA